MGFLNNLLKREARKIVSGVLDEVVDSVTDNIRDSVRENKNSSSATVSSNSTAKAAASSVDEAEEDCCGEVAVVERRIEKVVSEEWGDRIEIRKNISSSEMGAEAGALDYTYGLYNNGIPVAMIIILDYPDDYWCKRTRLAKEACGRQSVGYVHFITRLPNRTGYIREQLKEIVHI